MSTESPFPASTLSLKRARPRANDAAFEGVFSDLAGEIDGIETNPERQWFAEGAIEGTPIVGIAGPEKRGKTWKALDLLVATSVGGAWLGRFPIRRTGPSVIVDGAENGAADIARRIARLARARGREPRDVVKDVRHVWAADIMLSTGNIGLERLLRACESVQPLVVVLDPWRNFLPGDENSSADTIEAMRQVARLRDHLRCIVVLLHHVNRGGTLSGSRALRGRCDLFLEGQERSEGGEPTFQSIGRTLRRGSDPIAQPYRIDLVHDARSLPNGDDDERSAQTSVAFRPLVDASSVPAPPPPATRQPSKDAQRALKVLQDAGKPLSQRQIRELTHWNNGIARHALDELRSFGLADLAEAGGAKIWSLTEANR